MHISEQLDNICATGLTPNGYYYLSCLLNGTRPITINIDLEKRVLLSTGFLNTDESLSIKATDTGLFNTKEKGAVRSLYEEYLECWKDVPTKLPSGKYTKGNKVDILKELRKYVVKYRHTSEMILEATKKYLDKQEQEGYKFCRTAQYFISKDGNSDLATEVDNLIEEVYKPKFTGVEVR